MYQWYYAQYIDISVNFSQSTYSIEEDDGPVQLMLLLSNPSPTDITVEVYSIDINGSASGK